VRRRGLDTAFLERLARKGLEACARELPEDLHASAVRDFALAGQFIQGTQVTLHNEVGAQLADFRFVTPKLYGAGRNDDGLAWMRMEYLPGQHFSDLDPRDKKTVLVAMAVLGLNTREAWSGGCLHRDWHPGNMHADGSQIGLFDLPGMYREDGIAPSVTDYFRRTYTEALLRPSILSGIADSFAVQMARNPDANMEEAPFILAAADNMIGQLGFQSYLVRALLKPQETAASQFSPQRIARLLRFIDMSIVSGIQQSGEAAAEAFKSMLEEPGRAESTAGGAERLNSLKTLSAREVPFVQIIPNSASSGH
jgi:hypothetical protein